MMARIFYIFVSFVFCIKFRVVLCCINENSCLCEIDEYKKIDLSSLSSQLKQDEFLSDEDTNGNIFYFHGCTDGKLNPQTYNITTNGTKEFDGSLFRVNTTYEIRNNTVANITYVNTTIKHSIVQQLLSKQIKFVPVENQKETYRLIFTDGLNVSVRIDLICSHYESSFIKILSTEGTNPVLALTSSAACIITTHIGLSTGSVLLILFFITFGVYFIGGCGILYFMRGARGLEMIPNIDFWRSLPGLVKDGIVFLFSGCNSSAITTPETYDRI